MDTRKRFNKHGRPRHEPQAPDALVREALAGANPQPLPPLDEGTQKLLLQPGFMRRRQAE